MVIKGGHHLWSSHPHVRAGDELTFGEKSADKMRNVFGSWAFVGTFLGVMAAWVVLNTVILRHSAFDRYPYILLNLGLSMMAGLQGALILIAAKRADRVSAEASLHHYEETAAIRKLQDDQMTILNTLAEIRTAQVQHARVAEEHWRENG
jgi:uncharacterized membrane protein